MKMIKNYIPKTMSGYFAIIFVIIIVIFNITWLVKDQTPPTYDPAWYLENSEIMYHSLIEKGLTGFYDAFSTAFRTKAPLISVLPIPFYIIFGNSENVAYLSLILCTFILNFYLFRLTTLIKDKKTAFLSIIIFNTFPAIIGISRSFFVEYFLISVILAWFYYLLKSQHLTDKKITTILGIILGIGMLLKVLFPIYIFAPTIFYIYISYKNRKIGTKKFFYNCLKILFLGLIIASTWYYKNLISIFLFALSNGFGDIANNYSMGESFSQTTIIRYYKTVINYGISAYYFFSGIIIFIFYLIINKKQKIKKDHFWLLIIYFFVPLIIFTLGVNKAYRFLTPIFPATAIFFSIILLQVLRKIPYKYGLITLLCLFPVFNYLYLSFNFLPNKNFTYKSFYFLNYYLQETRRYSLNYWPLKDVVSYIYKTSIWYNNRVNIAVFPSIPEMNHNNLNYYARLANYKNIFFTDINEKNLKENCHSIEKYDFLIINQNQTDFKNNCSFFKEINTFYLKNNNKLILYQKI